MLIRFENISGKLKPCIKLIVLTCNGDGNSSKIDGDHSLNRRQSGFSFLVGTPEGVCAAQNAMVNATTRLKIPNFILRLIEATQQNKGLLILKGGGDGKTRTSNGR